MSWACSGGDNFIASFTNDFANTTQDGYRAIVAAFCLVSRFVDWANPRRLIVTHLDPLKVDLCASQSSARASAGAE